MTTPHTELIIGTKRIVDNDYAIHALSYPVWVLYYY